MAVRGVKATTPLNGVFVALVVLLTAGCAVNPLSSQSNDQNTTVAERDLLADAASAVEDAPWPRPQQVSFISRITGAGDDDRITKSDAAALYANSLSPAGARFVQLERDAQANLSAATRLRHTADMALYAPRLTNNDVAMVETAIQALRENRQVFVNAAHQIEKTGESIDDEKLDAIRDAYTAAIRDLGETADALADRLDHDRSENYAAPTPRPNVNNLSGV